MSNNHHFLILTYPVHSHINPTLQLARRLLRLGVKVTFATTPTACHRISTQYKHNDLDLVEIPENYIKCFSAEEEQGNLEKLEIRQNISAILAKVISTSTESGWPITCSVYTPTVPWVMGVVQQLPKPAVLLWTQPAAVLVIYYHFFFGYNEAMMHLFEGKDSIGLPGLPFSLESRDLPTFMRPVTAQPWALKLFELQTKWIARKENTNILVNTFESLEPEALKAVNDLNMIPIGPLIPKKDDMEGHSNAEYVQWLNSKADRSVVYVSFGSIWDVSNEQIVEVANALLDVGRPFLWIIRTPEKQNKEAEDVLQIECRKELDQLGLIVPWCIQIDVLSHNSIGCFVTHCGWNSTLEGLAAGVPMVGIPLMVEQVTNATLVEKYWKCGLRAGSNETDLVKKDEIIRCLELVMGDEGMRENAGKWKELAAGAAGKNGPADDNLSNFLAGLKSDQ